ncbi:hypothetical protein Q1695_014802 [Nippostrongylus brasiliensis]|nr:hypothetical protein Q1695_014802 [Nippostrongylus brasiliensis]
MIDGAGDADDAESLNLRFRKAEDVVNDIGEGRFSTVELQDRIKEAVGILEDLTRAVSMVGLFSVNEEVEDLPTSSIQFLLIPCYLGVVHHNTVTEPLHRAEQLGLAKIYYRDFLKRLRNYGFEFERDCSFMEDGQEGVSDESRHGVKKFTGEELRERKIARFRKQKELKAAMAELRSQHEQNNSDESILRQLHLTIVKFWQEKALEELESIEEELPLVEMMKKRMQGGSESTSTDAVKTNGAKQAPLRPFIIARSEQQKKVFGLGYPSIPTMTVDEWYSQRFGDKPIMSGNQQQKPCEDGDADACGSTDREREEEDDRERARLMRWDEYKDTHRRGWGNTHNKG